MGRFKALAACRDDRQRRRVTVSVCGLGKLGAPLAAALASRGFDVIGYDRLPGPVAALAAGRAPVAEPGLADLITAHRARLRAVADATAAIHASELTFVIVPTPSEPDGSFSLQYARAAFAEIGAALATKASFHHVVLCSTVLPGATRHGLLPMLEQASGKVCGRDFTLSYNPEFIALGSVIRDLLNPDFVLIGEHDPAGGAALEAFYARFLAKPAPCRRMSLENAEIAKISLNAYVTAKISFANLLADYCEAVPGGDADAVCAALGDDLRIGRKYFSGGQAFGGPCFPRDNRALAAFAGKVGLGAEIPLATAAYNAGLLQRSVAHVQSLVPPGGAVGILGLAYKPDTAVTEEAPGFILARELAAAGIRVVAHDPVAAESARAALPPGVTFAATPAECLRAVAVAVITTPDRAYRALGPDDFPAPLTVVDYWRVLGPAVTALPHLRVLRRGHNPAQPAADSPLAAWWRQA